MAAGGLWVKVAAALPRHYKTLRLAEDLAIPVHECVGKLVGLWIYCVEFANEGILTTEDFRRAFFAPDEPQNKEAVETALRALLNCGMPSHAGFLDDITPEGATTDEERRFLVHDWTSYSGTYRPQDEETRLSSINRGKKKRGEQTKKEESAPTATRATSAPEKAANNENAPEVPAQLPRVKVPLANNAGENFRGIRDVFAEIIAKYDKQAQ